MPDWSRLGEDGRRLVDVTLMAHWPYPCSKGLTKAIEASFYCLKICSGYLETALASFQAGRYAPGICCCRYVFECGFWLEKLCSSNPDFEVQLAVWRRNVAIGEKKTLARLASSIKEAASIPKAQNIWLQVQQEIDLLNSQIPNSIIPVHQKKKDKPYVLRNITDTLSDGKLLYGIYGDLCHAAHPSPGKGCKTTREGEGLASWLLSVCHLVNPVRKLLYMDNNDILQALKDAESYTK